MFDSWPASMAVKKDLTSDFAEETCFTPLGLRAVRMVPPFSEKRFRHRVSNMQSPGGGVNSAESLSFLSVNPGRIEFCAMAPPPIWCSTWSPESHTLCNSR
jgi:hypothetical protein